MRYWLEIGLHDLRLLRIPELPASLRHAFPSCRLIADLDARERIACAPRIARMRHALLDINPRPRPILRVQLALQEASQGLPHRSPTSTNPQIRNQLIIFDTYCSELTRQFISLACHRLQFLLGRFSPKDDYFEVGLERPGSEFLSSQIRLYLFNRSRCPIAHLQ